MEILEAHQGAGPGPAALTWGPARVGDHDIVLCRWDFSTSGGSFGERDATGFCDAAAAAIEAGHPLVCATASGGTRLTEGIPALVGMARATIARQRLAAAGVPLIALCEQPTTGGVWVTVGAPADLRCAVAGATVGFAGPRVVEAVTGSLPRGSHLAETAAEHGLVDALVSSEGAEEWLRRVLDARTTVPSGPAQPAGEVPAPGNGWEQVQASRASSRPSGRALLDQLLSRAVTLSAPHGDRSVACSLGRLDGRAVVAVALGAQRSGHPTPDGFRLLIRAADLAGRWGLPLLTVVDTPGADPTAGSENDALARTIAEAFDAVLRCPSPTVAVLTGEGGSGGALAALVADAVLATPDSYFAALVPEGAAAALRKTPADAAEVLGVGPALLVEQGVVDRLIPVAGTPGFAASVAAALDEVVAREARLEGRLSRWSGPVVRS